MKNTLREVKIRNLKEGERAYLIRLSEFGKAVYEVLITNSDPTIECRVINTDYIEFIGKDYTELLKLFNEKEIQLQIFVKHSNNLEEQINIVTKMLNELERIKTTAPYKSDYHIPVTVIDDGWGNIRTIVHEMGQ